MAQCLRISCNRDQFKAPKPRRHSTASKVIGKIIFIKDKGKSGGPMARSSPENIKQVKSSASASSSGMMDPTTKANFLITKFMARAPIIGRTAAPTSAIGHAT